MKQGTCVLTYVTLYLTGCDRNVGSSQCSPQLGYPLLMGFLNNNDSKIKVKFYCTVSGISYTCINIHSIIITYPQHL